MLGKQPVGGDGPKRASSRCLPLSVIPPRISLATRRRRCCTAWFRPSPCLHRPGASVAPVLREVAARVSRIRTVREDDGLDTLRDAAAGRGRFARVEEADDGEVAPARAREEEGFRQRGWSTGGSMCTRGCAWKTTTGRAWSGCVATSRGPRCAASGWSCWRIRSVAYRLKTPRRGGETHRVMRPQGFMGCLVALIPPPRFPLVRYHGVFAPNSPWRGAIVPGPRRLHHRDRGRTRASVARRPVAGAEGALMPGSCLSRWDWATLLRHVWGVDALACPRCDGRMRFIAVIRDRAVIERILLHLGLPHEPPPTARARAP